MWEAKRIDSKWEIDIIAHFTKQWVSERKQWWVNERHSKIKQDSVSEIKTEWAIESNGEWMKDIIR